MVLWQASEQLADLGNNQRVWLCCHNFFKIPFSLIDPSLAAGFIFVLLFA
jgi:hypothetical protein